jgi:DNA replication protein DnaC
MGMGTIEGFRAINLAGPLQSLRPDSRTEMAQCVECGMQFEQTIYIRPDGSDVPPDPRCERCSSSYERNQRAATLKYEVAEADARQRQTWRESCGLGEMFRGKTFEAFDAKLQPAAYKAMHQWDGKSIVLASPGTYGVGKTHLVAALAHRLIEASDAAISVQGAVVRMARPVLFTTEQRLLGRIRATFGDNTPENDEAIYLELERIRLLIIDDVGKLRPRDPSFLQQVWYRVIDARYTSRRPIVLTTNLRPAELEQHIGGAAADRLTEMCGRGGLIDMKGESYRRAR